MSVLQALRPSPLMLLAALVWAAGPAAAAVYKCQQTGGPVTYQQAPCPDGGGAAEIHAPSPSSADEAAARERARKDKAAAEQLDREQEARHREALREAESREATRRLAEVRCAKYLEDADTLERRSRTHSKGHDRELDERKAESLRKRHFSECYLAGR